MDDSLLLDNEKPQTFEFQLDVEGIDPKDANVRFIIDAETVSHAFACEKKDEKIYSIYIPPLPFLEKKAYSCKIEVVIDGYYFVPMTGTVNITDRPQVTITPIAPEKDTKQSVTPIPEPSQSVLKKTPEEKQRSLDDLLKSIKAHPIIMKKQEDEKDLEDEEINKPGDITNEREQQIEHIVESNTTSTLFEMSKDEAVRKAIETLNAQTREVKPARQIDNIELNITKRVAKNRKVREVLDTITTKTQQD